MRDRLPLRLKDSAELSFSEFIADVDSFGTEKFEDYATEVMKNRQKIAGRLKVEVAYRSCEYLRSYQKGGIINLERMEDFHKVQRNIPNSESAGYFRSFGESHS